MNVKPLRLGLAIALVTMALDQLTKWWVLEFIMQPPRVINLAPFFNLVTGWNRGVSFGMFSSDSPWSGWILSALAVIISGVLIGWLRKAEKRHNAIAIGLIIGGALGNVADRMVHGAVFDFLDVYVAGYHWPAFNVADSGITIGAAILVLDSLFAKSENGCENDSVEKT